MDTNNPRGIVCMIASMALFVGNDALMKFASQTVPLAQATASHIPGTIRAERVRSVFMAALTR